MKYLIANPSESDAIVIEMLEGLILDARQSHARSTQQDSQARNIDQADDVESVADNLLREVRTRHVSDVKAWQRLKRNIHPAWHSFRNSEHVT